MQVKIDFSEDCKANNYRLDRPDTYAIYVRKNCFHKWKQIQTYADVSLALYDFRKLKGEELTGRERLEKLQPQLSSNMDTVEKSNTPTSYGKYISEKCDEACELFYRPETDENRYSLADVFYAGVNAIRNIVEVVDVKESPLKTFPRVNEFECGGSYRH